MGRPRKDSVREPNGRARRRSRRAGFHRDFGTDEGLAQRALMVAGFPDPTDPKRKCDPADQWAGSPLGILWLRGEITKSERDAGVHYLRLHCTVYGTRMPKSCLAAIEVPNGLPDEAARTDEDPPTEAEREERRAEVEAELGETTAALLALPTRRPYSVLCNLALYDQPMRFMDTSRRRTPAATEADRRDLEALKRALDMLVAVRRRRHPA